MGRKTGWINYHPRRSGADGFSLVEMMVVIAVLSILAVVTIPYAEITVQRNKELELRRDLREMRGAIDRFHDDWLVGTLPKTSWNVSTEGYPKTLDALSEGIRQDPMKAGLKYLRRIPENPFGDKDLTPAKQWAFRGYADSPGSFRWNSVDVYDVYCPGDGKALDGSSYHDW